MTEFLAEDIAMWVTDKFRGAQIKPKRNSITCIPWQCSEKLGEGTKI